MSNNKPVITLRDGNLKIAIWKNANSKGPKYSVTSPVRIYRDEEGNWHETFSLSGTELLQAHTLLMEAYSKIHDYRMADKTAA